MKNVQTIKFNDFLNGNYKDKDLQEHPYKTNKLYSFVGVPINITAFLDPTIITISSIVLLIALSEKMLANYGLYDTLAKVEGFMSFLFPVVTFGFLLYVLSHL